MGINTMTNAFKEKIVNEINNCGLPAINILYVLKDVEMEVNNIYQKALLEESTEVKDNGNNND